MTTATATGVCIFTGKTRMSKRDAFRTASWWRHQRFARMNAYYCGRCDVWHVGNDRRKPRRGRS